MFRPTILLLLLLGTLIAQERTNILVIICDDLRHDALGAVQREQGKQGRFPWFKTPGFDRLANDGLRLRNAFVICSLCSPSRAAFLTGRYNHHNGVIDNHTAFPVDSVTWATLLQQAGYVTGYVGKWHMSNQKERPGFGWSASFVGQGRYEDCPFVVDGKIEPTSGWVDDVSTDFAIGFLKRNRDQPFALQLGFKTPHGPWTPPARTKEQYAEVKARGVPNLNHPAIYLGRKSGDPAEVEVELKDQQRNYFRCVSAIDDNVTRVLTALDELDLTRRTLVIFTSDNGFYLGEHGLGDKRSMYDESLRIPLLLRLPGRIPAGATSDAMTLNLDLAPTILELAGVQVPTTMQGRSLMMIARDVSQGKATASWRDAFLYEYFYETPYRIPTILGLRTMNEKFITYPGRDQWLEVFDLAQDPFEVNNLVGDPAAATKLQVLMRRLEQEKTATGFLVPTHADRDEFDTQPPPARKTKEP